MSDQDNVINVNFKTKDYVGSSYTEFSKDSEEFTNAENKLKGLNPLIEIIMYEGIDQGTPVKINISDYVTKKQFFDLLDGLWEVAEKLK